MFFKTFLFAIYMLIAQIRADKNTNTSLVYEHVKKNARATFKEPSGHLKYKYLVPGGPYNQLWDWDSFFMGVAMFEFGSAEYLSGSMKNFLSNTNVTDGEVQGCLLPSGGTGTIFHAKPVIIQGAWLAAKQMNSTGDLGEEIANFKQFQPQMKSLLKYWSAPSSVRTDPVTGLPKWYNQLESGEDNLPLSTCASSRSFWCWNKAYHELKIVSADLSTFLYREYQAYSAFCDAWANHEESKRALLEATKIKDALNKYLWKEEYGYYVALNTTKLSPLSKPSKGKVDPITGYLIVNNRVDVMGFPLMAADIASADQVKTIRDQLFKEDMLSSYGIRSTSSSDPRYNNRNEIKPYSNWQGPVWVNVNAIVSYGFMRYSAKGSKLEEDAAEIANRVVNTLAEDLRQTQTWHEGYDSENGMGLAANGFLSWDTLSAVWQQNLKDRKDPFLISL
jgi:alpha,alpha-trehalase